MTAYTTINDPSAYFKVQKFTGNYSDAHAITFNDTDTTMQPDLVVVKQTDAADAWYISDAARGVTKTIYSDVATAEETIAEGIQAFGSNGFTVVLYDIAGNVNIDHKHVTFQFVVPGTYNSFRSPNEIAVVDIINSDKSYISTISDNQIKIVNSSRALIEKFFNKS